MLRQAQHEGETNSLTLSLSKGESDASKKKAQPEDGQGLV